MRKLSFVLLSTMLLMLGSTAWSANNLNVGVVDVHKILANAPEVAKINNKLKSEFKPREEKINRLDKRLQDQTAKLERDGAVMSTSERNALASTVAKERRTLYRLQQDFHDDLSVAERQATQSLMEKVQNAVNIVAKKKNYDLVLQKNGIPYASSSVDITDEVMKILKQKS